MQCMFVSTSWGSCVVAGSNPKVCIKRFERNSNAYRKAGFGGMALKEGFGGMAGGLSICIYEIQRTGELLHLS